MTTEIKNTSDKVVGREQLALEITSAILLTQADQITKQAQGQITEGCKFTKGLIGGGVQCIQQAAQSLVVASDYYGQTFQGSVDLGTDVKEFGNAIGQPLSVAGEYYFNKLPKGQSDFCKDAGEATTAATKHWNSLDSEQKGNFIGEQALPFAVSGAIGLVAKEVQSANLFGKIGDIGSTITNSGVVNQVRASIQKLGPRQLAFETVGISDLSLGSSTLSSELPKISGAKVAGSSAVIGTAINDTGKQQHIMMMSQSKDEARLAGMESQRVSKAFKSIEEAEVQALKDIEVDKEIARKGHPMGSWFFRVADRANRYLNSREVGINDPARMTYSKHYKDTYKKLREEDSVLRERM